VKRDAIRKLLIGDEPSPIWVPLLTHYREAAEGAAVDAERLALHATGVVRCSTRWVLGGQTGDGWDLSETQFDALLEFARRSELRQAGVRIFIGVLRPTTIEVRALIDRVHRAAGTSPGATLESNVLRLAARGWAGICVCPPVGAGVTQEEIVLHYRDICESARLPVAVYQIPRSTRNEITYATLVRMLGEHEGMIAYADFSGDDDTATSLGPGRGALLLRGSEGRYAGSLRTWGGPYDGLLIGTANCLGGRTNKMLEVLEAGDLDKAKAVGRSLSELIRRLFEAGAGAPVGGVSSNVNRAVDHCLAYGRAFHEFPSPILHDGSRLPERALADVATILDEAGLMRDTGYLAAKGA